MKKKILLDLDGVVFEPIKGLVIKAAFAKHGLVKGSVLLSFYKFGVFNKYVSKHVGDIIYNYATNAAFLPAAEKAVARLTNLPDCSVEVVSKVGFVGMSERFEEHFRKISCMAKVEKFNFVVAGESKKTVYTKVRQENPATVIYAVDDKPSSLKAAYDNGINAILISKNSVDVKKVKNKYRGLCCRNLASFQEFMNNQQILGRGR